MGKIVYSPKKVKEVKVGMNTKEQGTNPSEERIKALIENINSVRPIGNTDCDYAVYLEDYAYTYIYQYANTDLGSEHSAAIIGEYYPETKEIIICGIMPVPKDKLKSDNEWINDDALQSLMETKESYFPNTEILGWLHMQPGYGTMLTMKEVKVHRDLFDRMGTMLLLVDPINKIETFFVYEGDTLREQTGYYIYYDKNPSMQQYMLDKPFVCQVKEEVEDTVVTQFREIGQRRKKEYEQRKKTNFTVVAASVVLLAMSAILIRMDQQDDLLNNVMSNLNNPSIATDVTGQHEGESIPFVFQEETPLTVPLPQSDLEQAESEIEDLEVTVQEEQVVEVAEEDTDESVDEESDIEEQVSEEDTLEETPMEDAIAQEQDDQVAVEYTMYTVESGDTLRIISTKHFDTELRARDIIALNDLENGDHIYVGQELKIPTE